MVMEKVNKLCEIFTQPRLVAKHITRTHSIFLFMQTVKSVLI